MEELLPGHLRNYDQPTDAMGRKFQKKESYQSSNNNNNWYDGIIPTTEGGGGGGEEATSNLNVALPSKHDRTKRTDQPLYA